MLGIQDKISQNAKATLQESFCVAKPVNYLKMELS